MQRAGIPFRQVMPLQGLSADPLDFKVDLDYFVVVLKQKKIEVDTRQNAKNTMILSYVSGYKAHFLP